jgi:hypothetical protein
MTFCLPVSLLGQAVSELELSLRTINALQRAGFAHLEDLAGLDAKQLEELPNIGAGAIREIEAALARHGLDLPFSREQGLQVVGSPAHGLQQSLDPSETGLGGSNADGTWCIQAQHRLSQPGDTAPERLLQELGSYTAERYAGLHHRFSQLSQLIECCHRMVEAAGNDDQGHWLVRRTQQELLRRYGAELAPSGNAAAWLRQLLKAMDHPAALQAWFDQCRGIATAASVRKHSLRLQGVLGCAPRQLQAEWTLNNEHRQHNALQAAALAWIRSSGRLPFHGAEQDHLEGCTPASAALLTDRLNGMTLPDRLAFHHQLGLLVPDAEWDLHALLIAAAEPVGTGYWIDPEPLRQFLHRDAARLGRPGRMPMQKQLPDSVKGAVQRHGGQSAVARAMGLAYQGQLVGENGGRTYWTEARLRALLAETESFHGLPAGAMPSRLQIRDFLQTGPIEAYRDKRPESVYAALNRQSTLSWAQVAERFGRCP